MAAKEAKDALLVEISLRVSAVRHLPPGVNRNPLRVHATLGGSRQETGECLPGKGGAGEAIWLKSPESLVKWTMTDSEFTRVKAYSPKFKCALVANQVALAWFMVDVRDLAGDPKDYRWLKMKSSVGGLAYGEMKISGAVRFIGRVKATAQEEETPRPSLTESTPAEQAGGGAQEEEAFPVGEGKGIFQFSIMLEKAGGSGKGLQLPGLGQPMWISYKLLGSTVQTEDMVGWDPEGKSLGGVIDLFIIKSNPDGSELCQYFREPEHRFLTLFLCTEGQRTLGTLRLDLMELLELETPHFPIEKAVRYEILDEEVQEGGGGEQGLENWVDVSVKLERVEAAKEKEEEVKVKEQEDVEKDRFQKKTALDVSVGSSEEEYSEDYSKEESRSEGREEEEEGEEESISKSREGDEMKEEKGGATIVRRTAVAEGRKRGVRRFRLSIDLRALKDTVFAGNLFLSYHYPYLSRGEAGGGGMSMDLPVTTGIVWTPVNLETAMKNACCLFVVDFTWEALEETFREWPFMVKVKRRDGANVEEIGLASLPMLELARSKALHYRCPVSRRIFRSRKACEQEGEGEAIEVRAMDEWVPVFGANDDVVGLLRAVVVLEDMSKGEGEGLEAASVSTIKEEAAQVSKEEKKEGGQERGAPVTGKEAAVAAVLGALEIEKRKLEWEEWRHKEEVAWSEQLRQKEALKMEQLEKLAEQKEKDRRMRFQVAHEEFTKLEDKLRKALAEVEARERRLITLEEEVRHQQAQKVLEFQSLQKRMKEESTQQIEAERGRNKELSDRIIRLEKALKAGNQRYEDLEEDFSRYRQEQKRRPVSVLQEQLLQVQGEKAEIEARYERERAEKHRALLEKEQYRAALKRMSQSLKREQNKQNVQLRQELEQLKIEYIAREERFVLDGQREELKTIRKELENLRDVSLISTPPKKQQPTPSLPTRSPQHAEEKQESTNKEINHEDVMPKGGELDRLRREKEELLSTGLYCLDDALIVELDRMIAQKEEDRGSIE